MAIPPFKSRAPRVIKTDLGLEFSKIGASRFDFSDPYHVALTVGWPTFVFGVFALYGVITSFFAILYLALPGCIANARTGSISDAFFFSIETLATVGYGEMAPASLYGHLVSSAEIITGVAFTAIMTGLIFVRFSKPKAKIIYADVAVIARHNGKPTLMLRIGNARATVLTQLKVELHALIRETTIEGGRFRRMHDLPLIRSSLPIFPMITTLMHEIDETSPLASLDRDSDNGADTRLFLSLEAHDPEIAATVFDVKSWDAANILEGRRFVDAVSQHPDGHTVADLTRISLTEPDEDDGLA